MCKGAKNHNGYTAVTESGEENFITEARKAQWFTHGKPHLARIGTNLPVGWLFLQLYSRNQVLSDREGTHAKPPPSLVDHGVKKPWRKADTRHPEGRVHRCPEHRILILINKLLSFLIDFDLIEYIDLIDFIFFDFYKL